MQADPSQLPFSDGTSDDPVLAALNAPDESPAVEQDPVLAALNAPDRDYQAEIAAGSQPNADPDAKQRAADAARQLAVLNASSVGGVAGSQQSPADVISGLGHDQLMASDRYRQIYDAAIPVLGQTKAMEYAKQTLAADTKSSGYQRDAIISDLMGMPKDTALKTNYDPWKSPSDWEMLKQDPGRYFSGIGESMRGQLRSSLGGAVEAIGEQLPQPMLHPDIFLEQALQGKAMPGDQNEIAQFGQRQYERGQAEQERGAAKTIQPPTPETGILGKLPYLAQGVVESAPILATGPIGMGVSAAGQKYGEAREAGESPETAARAAAIEGAANYAAGQTLFGNAVGEGAETGLKGVAKATAGGVGSMLESEVGNIAAEAGAEGKEISPEEVQTRLTNAIESGALVGGGLHAVAGGAHPALEPKFAKAAKAIGDNSEGQARLDYVRAQSADKGAMWTSAELRNLAKNGTLRDEAGFDEWRQQSDTPEAIVEPTPAETATPEADATTRAAEELVGKPEAPAGLPGLQKPIVTADEAKAQALHDTVTSKVETGELTQEQADAVKQHMEPARRDTLTGFLAQEHHDPSIERAQRWVEETGQPAQYMTFDLRNIGGLNGEYGHTATNDIIGDLANIVHEEAPASHAELARNGGDEIAGPVYGVTPEQANAIRDRVEQRAKQYSTENGHDEIANPKYPGDESQKGTGIAGFTSEIVPGVPIGEITRRADTALERRKNNGPATRIEAGNLGDETGVAGVGSDVEGARTEGERSVLESGAPKPEPEPTAEAPATASAERVNPLRNAAGVPANVPRTVLRNQQPDAVTMHGYTGYDGHTTEGVTGQPLDRLNLPNSNKNLRQRMNFSAERGPDHTHETVLTNLYPLDADPRDLMDKARTELERRGLPTDKPHLFNEFERQVIHAGYDGVYSKGQGYALGGKPRLRPLTETTAERASTEEAPNVPEKPTVADVGRDDAQAGRGAADDARQGGEGARPSIPDEKAAQDADGRNGPRVPAKPERPPAHPQQPVGEKPERPPVGISNAETERLAVERGTATPEKRAAKTIPEYEAEAKGVLKTNPKRGEELAAEVSEKPRNLTGTEGAILAMDRKRIDDEYHAAAERASAAMDAGDNDGESQARAQMRIALDAAERNAKAATHAGTEWHESGMARQLLAAQDYSLTRMLTETRVAKGAPLTEAEHAKVVEQHKVIAEAQKQQTEAQAPKTTRKQVPKMVENAAKSEFKKLSDQFHAMKPEDIWTKECAIG